LIDEFLEGVRLKQLNRSEAAFANLSARASREPTLQPWRQYLAGILANERDHDSAEAERLFLAVLYGQPAPEPDLVARLHLALGMTYWRQGRWADSIAACQHSLSAHAALDDRLGQAKVLKLMVIVRCEGFDAGDLGAETLQDALKACRLALSLLDHVVEQTSETRWLAGTLWNEQGAVHRTLGQWSQAIDCYQRYLVISQALGHRFGVGLAYTNIAESYARQGPDHWVAALEAFAQGLPILHEVGHRPQEAEALSDLAFLYRAMGEPAAALELYEQVIANIQELRAGITSEAARAGYSATIAEVFANATLAALQGDREDLAFNLVERARSRAFLDLLAFGASRLQREAEAETLTLSHVQAALAPDAVLVEYVTMGVLEPAASRPSIYGGANRNRFPPGKTLIFVVTCDGLQVVDADLSPNTLNPRRLASAVESHFLSPVIRRMLYDKLVAPVASQLAGKRRVYLVPHGPLHFVPFQALIAPDGETLLRPGGPELVYGPSATVLFQRAQTGALAYDPAQQVQEETLAACLALGYNGAGPQALRFAEEEARRIAGLLGGRALVGWEADREALFRHSSGVRYLHVSCHGEFDPDSPLDSLLHLARGETVTAGEVLERLRLACDLVTLSACESGLSRVRRGDELMGLVRAFMVAGAPAVVATLWRVDERSTRILMERFYREVMAGASFALALQHAQIYLRGLTKQEATRLLEGHLPGSEDDAADLDRPFADPLYWAPFVLIGAG
jgi:CHAT domain-containing protein/tetratricopeptide (TPR) repeat protein